MLLDAAQARCVLDIALEHRFALLAVNADSPAALIDVLEGARQVSAPVMIEASLWQLTGHSFGAGDAILGLGRYLVQLAHLANSERFREVPVFFHTDHIKGSLTLPLLRACPPGERGLKGLDGNAVFGNGWRVNLERRPQIEPL